MPDTPYGVTGCRCAVDSDGGEARWAANPHCPYHGLLPRDRTDTGVYRVVRGDDDGGNPYTADTHSCLNERPRRDTHTCDHPDCIGVDTDHHTVAVMTTTGYVLDCAGRGCPVARRLPDGTAVTGDEGCPECEQYGECLDCEQAREEHEERVRAAAERVERASEGLNQRLAARPKRAWWRRIMEHFNGI